MIVCMWYFQNSYNYPLTLSITVRLIEIFINRLNSIRDNLQSIIRSIEVLDLDIDVDVSHDDLILREKNLTEELATSTDEFHSFLKQYKVNTAFNIFIISNIQYLGQG